MKSLKQIINRYIRFAAIVMTLVILVVIAFAEILIEQGRVEDTAAGTFVRLEQIIEENENELKQVKEKYDKTCLHDAEAIAFLLQKDPEATNDTLKLKKYANLLELDEIHIFDETGTIVSGTNPEYYGYSFSSGEQMAFFAPMLTDKSLQLVQDAGPNTAEGKNMQYSAVWSADGTFIVQVGKDPQLVTEAMEKNEISYIFHQLNISPAIDYCAVDSETLSVIGATNADMVGKTVAKLGISAESMQNEEHGFHANSEGKYYYCVFKKIETRRDTDPLTRLFYNRRGLSRRVERILEAGTGDTYAVVMIDLDDLKEVNDTYGHESGDQYIISAAEILKKIVGESGLTARHGGDEFVLFLEEKSEEALREKLTQLEQAQDSSEAVLHDGQHVPLRFSMGCCFIDEVAAPYDEMLEKADIAMYQNKRQRKEKHGKQPRRKE